MNAPEARSQVLAGRGNALDRGGSFDQPLVLLPQRGERRKMTFRLQGKDHHQHQQQNDQRFNAKQKKKISRRAEIMPNYLFDAEEGLLQERKPAPRLVHVTLYYHYYFFEK